jgi:class 3 adenylate cyclase/tetratricopeptide (TPR) repeat protein
MYRREELEKAIAALEAQRGILGDGVVDAMVAAAREKLAALEKQPASEQRKQVTVLFADISGFTAMAEMMDAEEVHSTINALWQHLDATITAHGGMIDKHIGDAVMALFGAPTAHEDDPERAIRAALAMQQAIPEFVQATHGPLLSGPIQAESLAALQMRIGIHTGPVVLGSVGTTAEYTAIGDTVNVARRLQYAAPVGGILISHDTYRHVRGVFDVEPLEPLPLKGKAAPVQGYVVQGAKPRAFRISSRGIEGLETRMIGRDEELNQLQERLRRALEQGQGEALLVSGEAGVGKSRLLYEFTAWIELLPESVRFFKGRTDPQMSQIPYALIRDVLAFRFEIQEGDSATVAREKLEQGFVSFMGEAGLEKAHFVGHLIGFDFSDSPYLRGILDDVRQIRDRAFYYAAQFFQTVTAEQPAVLFLEDIHWADDGALDLVDYLARECRPYPLVIVALARPDLFEKQPSWSHGGESFSHMVLKPLQEEDSRQLIAEILHKVAEMPADLPNLIVGRAGGNPFYIEELIKVLIEEEVIVKGRGPWQVRRERLADVGIPPMLTGVLQARLDRLTPLERKILQQASVVGRIFWDGVVSHIAQVDRGSVRETLQRLWEKEWLYSRQDATFPGEKEFLFKHALLHEVTYESVLRRQRRAYHAQVAEWLIEQSGERAAEYAGLVGSHYERAGRKPLAAEWYARAGKQAEDTYAPEAAIRYYQKALDFLPKTATVSVQRAAVFEGLGNELGRLGRYAAATQAYRAMLTAAESADDELAQAHAWERLAWVQGSQGNYHAAIENADHAEELSRATGAQVVLVRALHRKGLAFLELGRPEKALDLGEQALTLSTELSARREMAKSLNLLGAVHWLLGKHRQATRYMEEALSIHWELDDRQGVGVTLNDLAATAQMRGDFRSAIILYEDAREIFEAIGYREGELVCLSNLGGARIRLEEYPAAEVDLRRVLEMAESSSWFLSETYRFLAEALLCQGKLGEAEEAAQQALHLGKEIEQQEWIAGAWRALGMVAAQMGGSVAYGGGSYGAGDCFSESLLIYEETGMEGERARTIREWARYEIEHGDPHAGERMWLEARDIFDRLGMGMEVERMRNLPQRRKAEQQG